MNAVVRKILLLDTTSTLADLNTIAENFKRIGPVPAAALLAKLASGANHQPLTPHHHRVLNRVVPGLVDRIHYLPSQLAINTCTNLASLGLPDAHRAFSLLQDKWFENWNSAALEKSTKRPKQKLPVIGLYDFEERTKVRLTNYQALASLTDSSLSAVIASIQQLRNPQSLQPILSALAKESENRTKVTLELDSTIK